jgi:hypothetical protein
MFPCHLWPSPVIYNIKKTTTLCPGRIRSRDCQAETISLDQTARAFFNFFSSALYAENQKSSEYIQCLSQRLFIGVLNYILTSSSTYIGSCCVPLGDLLHNQKTKKSRKIEKNFEKNLDASIVVTKVLRVTKDEC